MDFPENLKYSKSHEWVSVDEANGIATIGITEFAQEQLGDIVFLDLDNLEVGTTVEADGVLTEIESSKAVSEINSPVSGEIVEINSELEDAPELINESPYEKAWIIKVKIEKLSESLMDAAAYSEIAK